MEIKKKYSKIINSRKKEIIFVLVCGILVGSVVGSASSVDELSTANMKIESLEDELTTLQSKYDPLAKAAADKAAADKAAADKAAADKAAADKAAADKAAADKAAADKAAADKAAADKAAADKAAADKAAADKAAADKAAADKAAASVVEENVYYENCTAVKDAGADPIYSSDPGYSSKLDRDGDGVACES